MEGRARRLEHFLQSTHTAHSQQANNTVDIAKDEVCPSARRQTAAPGGRHSLDIELVQVGELADGLGKSIHQTLQVFITSFSRVL